MIRNQFYADVFSDLELQEPTRIQKEVLDKWHKSSDFIGIAPTGSGKTLAFALVCLERIDITLSAPQVLVLCPTRELANQVALVFQRAARQLGNIQVVQLIGGVSVGTQIQSLKGACHIVVGTPGRVADHLSRRRLQLEQLKVRVLDEADRMLEMGMREEVMSIFSQTPKQVMTGLFSATFQDAVTTFAKGLLTTPTVVDVREETQKPSIKQLIHVSPIHNKLQALCCVLSHYQPGSAIVFCQTKKGVTEVFEHLNEKGFCAVQIQGDLDQGDRQRALAKLQLGIANVMVATDVAARGLDIPHVDMVISFDISESPETHTHRIGRTGRAGATGTAITLINSAQSDQAKAFCDDGLEGGVQGIEHLRFHANRIRTPEFAGVIVKAGKKDRISKGDIVGALTRDSSVPAADIGQIIVHGKEIFFAIKLRSLKRTLQHFRTKKTKGRLLRAYRL